MEETNGPVRSGLLFSFGRCASIEILQQVPTTHLSLSVPLLPIPKGRPHTKQTQSEEIAWQQMDERTGRVMEGVSSGLEGAGRDFVGVSMSRPVVPVQITKRCVLHRG